MVDSGVRRCIVRRKVLVLNVALRYPKGNVVGTISRYFQLIKKGLLNPI